MGLDSRLVLDADITLPAAKQLAEICRDWAGISYLKANPVDSPWREVHQSCENLFWGVLDELSIAELEKGKLTLEYEGKIDEAGLRVLTELLPLILVKLRVLFCEIPEMGIRYDYSFDEPKRALTRREVALDFSDAEEGFEEEFVSRVTWRKRLRDFLAFLGDLEFQSAVLVSKEKSADFDLPYSAFALWFDVHTYYMERLSFEQGLASLVEGGLLDADEEKKLLPLDKAIQNYLPEDLLTPDAKAILADPKWQAIARSAKQLEGAFR